MIRRHVLTPVVAGLVAVGLSTPVAVAATPPGSPVVLHLGVVTRQDIPSRGNSEPDTVVEPDVAVSPSNPNDAIAAAHDSRFANGGAVDISVAWTHDAGATWHHQPVRGIVTAAGGTWARTSDPVVAFGPDGTAYLSVLMVSLGCPTAVYVLRSTDAGQTWSKPVYAHRAASCDYSDDKNWLVVDTNRGSPHYGRVYQFWTPFLSTGATFVGSPQAVRWSDDHGRTWSATSYVSPTDHGTQNSQPMIEPDGTVVDTFYDSGRGQRAPDVTPDSPPVDATGSIYAATSKNGGRTWSKEVEVTNNGAGYADGVRCCLFGADIDSVTHTMYTAWEGGVGTTDPVYLSYSRDGTRWSSPIRVSRGDVAGVQRVNVDVVARAGHVYVAYGTRTRPADSGGVVQQQLSMSADGGRSFGPPTSIGPRSVLKYAAQAGGYFPGDYIGEAIAPGRLYAVWAVSSPPPPYSTSPYHQVIYGATLRP